MGEFELIRHYFQRTGPHPPGVVLGVGDDCALLQPDPGQRLAVLDRHAGRRPAFLRRCRSGRAGPQGARGQPVRPGRLGAQPARLHAGARAAARRRDLAGRLQRRPVCAGRCRGLSRWWRRRHHRTGRSTSASRVFGEVPAGPGAAAAAARGRATTSGSAASWASPAGSRGAPGLEIELPGGERLTPRAPAAGAPRSPGVALGLALRGVPASAAADV